MLPLGSSRRPGAEVISDAIGTAPSRCATGPEKRRGPRGGHYRSTAHSAFYRSFDCPVSSASGETGRLTLRRGGQHPTIKFPRNGPSLPLTPAGMTGVDPIVSRSAAGTSSSRTHLSLTGVESPVADQSQAIGRRISRRPPLQATQPHGDKRRSRYAIRARTPNTVPPVTASAVRATRRC